MGTHPRCVQTPASCQYCFKLSFQHNRSTQEHHTQHYQPLRPLYAVGIRLRVPQCFPLGVLCLLNLIGRSVTDENWLASPLDDDVLALWDGCKVNLNLGLGQDVCGSGHVDQEVCKQPSQPCDLVLYHRFALCYDIPCTVAFAPSALTAPNVPTMKYWKTLLLVSPPLAL